MSPRRKQSKKLRKYFSRLSDHILKKMVGWPVESTSLIPVVSGWVEGGFFCVQDYSAAAWELIRKEIRTLLFKTHLLVSTLLSDHWRLHLPADYLFIDWCIYLKLSDLIGLRIYCSINWTTEEQIKLICSQQPGYFYSLNSSKWKYTWIQD